MEYKDSTLSLNHDWMPDEILLLAYAHVSKEPSSYGALIRKAIGCGKCLINCAQITEPRVKMIILPLKITRGGASSCRFVAVE